MEPLDTNAYLDTNGRRQHAAPKWEIGKSDGELMFEALAEEFLGNFI